MKWGGGGGSGGGAGEGLVCPSLASWFSGEVLTEWETQRPIGRLACLHLLPPMPPSSSSDVSKKSKERLDGVTREYRQTLRICTVLLCIFMHVFMYRYPEFLKRYMLHSVLLMCVCVLVLLLLFRPFRHLGLHLFLKDKHLDVNQFMKYIWNYLGLTCHWSNMMLALRRTFKPTVASNRNIVLL